MFFKNATLFRLSPALLQAIVAPQPCSDGDAPVSELETGLAAHQLKPLGPMELATYGFTPPLGGDTTALAVTVGSDVLVTLSGESKIIPPSSVNSLLQKRLAEVEAKEGRRPGGRARKRIKEEIVHELLPKALTRPSRTQAIINTEHGYVAIDTPSRKIAENVLSHLRIALGSFPALPINPEVSPRSVLTGWLSGDDLPEGVSLGDEVELRDAADKGAVVRCRNQELLSDEVTGHVESGKQVTRLALVLDDRTMLTIDDAVTLRKIRLLDGAMESLADIDGDDLQAELTARFALMAGELTRVFQMLQPAFDLTETEG